MEFDAEEWANALSNERQRMVEQAVSEEFDNDFGLYGGQGIAECIDSGELDYTTTTQAEMHAEWEADAIETAIRVNAGIKDYDEWPGGVLRPIPRDSYMVQHKGVQYVVLRHKRNVLAVVDIAGGDYTVLTTWPKEIVRR